MTKKKTIDEIKNDFIKVHGTKYDYSKVSYFNSQTKVKIICYEHGEFEQQPNNHLMGKGCRKCSYINASIRVLSNTNDFIKKAKEKHGDKYNYSLVNYINNKTKVKIICSEHGEFEQKPSEHLSGCGCQICGKNKQIKLQTKTKEQFITEANNKHNNKYNYSLVEYINTHTKVKIICSNDNHQIFEQTPSSHLSGAGCPKCASIYQHSLLKSNNSEFIKKSKEKHDDKFDYSLVDYIDNQTKVKIICSEHGEFEQKPSEHLSGCGCPKCGFIKISMSKTYSTEEYTQLVENVHQNIYDYAQTKYNGIYNKINVICKKHGIFEITASNHLRGQGCSKCQTKKQYSKSQIKWLNFIQLKDNITIQHAENSNEFQIPNTRFKADGYCVDTNTIYEYHGDYWHGNPDVFDCNEFNKTTKCTFGELYQNTLNKEQQIRDMGFNLITIWESDWIKLNKCVRILQRKYRNSKLL